MNTAEPNPSNPSDAAARRTPNHGFDDPVLEKNVPDTMALTERTGAEESLRKTQEFLTGILDNAPLPIYSVSEEGRMRSANRFFADLVNMSQEKIIGSPLEDVFTEEEARQFREVNRKVIDTVTPMVEEEWTQGADGRRYFQTIRFPLRDREGKVDAIGGISIEVTERRRAEEALRESEERFRSTFNEASIGMVIGALDGRFVQVNHAVCEMLGYSEDELLATTFLAITHPDDLGTDLDNMRRMVDGEIDSFRTEKRYLHAEGHAVWASHNASVVRDPAGGPLYFIAQIQDISGRKAAEEERSRQTRNAALRADVGTAFAEGGELRSILERCTECMVRHLGAAFARIWTLNEAEGVLELAASAGMYTHLHGPHSRVSVGEYKIGRIAHERTAHLTNDVTNDPRISDKEWAKREGMVSFAGYPLVVEDRLVGVMALFAREPLEEDTTEALASVGDTIAQGIERKRVEERLQYRAFHDPLTGLPNRLLFEDRLDHALMRTRRQLGGVAVLFMDLDGFKIVNDSLGHEDGDRLLVAVAERLKGCVRREDALARFGGDEFTVLIEELEGTDSALRVTQRITKRFQRPFVLNGRRLFVKFSIGVALGDAYTESTDELLRNADTAMYRAKDEAADYRVFDPTMHEQALRRLELENDLRRALEKEEFTVYYQPKFRLGQTDTIEGVEALVRWEHPQKGFMLPGEFFQIAQETGLIIPIGGWVMKEACRQAKEWQERYPSEPPLRVCVNVSAGQVRHPGLHEDVRYALRESGLESGNLILEITENTLPKDIKVIETIFGELKALGVSLVMDDFGKEYSSLSYLNRLPVDALKIDRSFLERFGENLRNTIILEAVVSLAHSLGLEVTGEGVENAEQLELLRGMGCDFAQGYHLARPLPSEDVPKFLAE